MNRTITSLAVGAVVAIACWVQPAAAQDLQQKLAAAKQSAAANQKALRAYTWLQKTELRFKGEVKSTKVDSCSYGADGTLQKTPVVQPEPAERQRGLKGRIIEKKTDEMKDELESAAALIQQYVPPSPDMMQVVMNAGTASLAQAGPALVTLTFPGYAKAGDSLKLTFEQAVKSLRQIAVNTWLSKPDQAVTLQVTMASLPDGTSHPDTIVLTIPSSQIQVTVTHSNYQKLAR